jgi:diguanylate cyclase (GGDEF)-like protein
VAEPRVPPWANAYEEGRHVHIEDEPCTPYSPYSPGIGAADGAGERPGRIAERKGDERGEESLLDGTGYAVHTMAEHKPDQPALRDRLTDLPNPALFADRVEQTLRRRERTNEAFSILLIDLDDPGTLDDCPGDHTGDHRGDHRGCRVGDELLATVSGRVRGVLRASDTLARLDGDELAVLLDGADQSAAELVAARICTEVERPTPIQERGGAVRPSIGIVVARGYALAGDLMHNAEAAVRAAKTPGKNRCQVFRPNMHVEARGRPELKDELVRALDAREFGVHYQPIMRLDTGSVVGLEAFVRWAHPHLGLLAAEAFTSLAEESDLMVPIGEGVLREAAAFVQRLNRSRARPPLSLWINLSGQQLADPSLMQSVEEVLEESALDPSRLVVEIPEQVLVEDAEGIELVLGGLRDRGVGAAIDDFGWGYASLIYLRSLPIDILKIDRAFVAGAGRAEGTSVARAVSELGQALGFTTVAEGIETPEQCREVLRSGCIHGQGFLLSPPLRPAAVEAMLSAR